MVKSSRHKLDDKSEKCIFVSYSLNSKANRLYNPLSGKIVISRDVIVNEDASWTWSTDKDGRPIHVLIDDDATTVTIANTGEVSTEVSSHANTGPKTPQSSPSTAFSSMSSTLAHSSSGSSSETPPKNFQSLREIYETAALHCMFLTQLPMKMHQR